ncbi:MAG: carbon storage regulator [Planctomycetota bacterium]|jgi:carbon storage regulator
MLVLSRRQNERIRVGDTVVVTVVRVSGDKVRIGIEAPPHVKVLRDELPVDDVPAATPIGVRVVHDSHVTEITTAATTPAVAFGRVLGAVG